MKHVLTNANFTHYVYCMHKQALENALQLNEELQEEIRVLRMRLGDREQQEEAKVCFRNEGGSSSCCRRTLTFVSDSSAEWISENWHYLSGFVHTFLPAAENVSVLASSNCSSHHQFHARSTSPSSSITDSMSSYDESIFDEIPFGSKINDELFDTFDQELFLYLMQDD